MSEVASFYFLLAAFSLSLRAKTFMCGVLNGAFIYRDWLEAIQQPMSATPTRS
jgi:hypothetical protein